MTHHEATVSQGFVQARREGRALADYPGTLPATLDLAYAVQDQAIAAWKRPIRGWKVGRVMAPHAERHGVDRLAGPIFDVQTAGRSAEVAMPVFDNGFIAAEAEFLLRMGRTPSAGQVRFSLDEARALIDAVHVGIEIASSPLATINDLGPAAVISDFGNNNGLVIGPPVPDWQSSGFENWEVETVIDGNSVGTGRASAFPDGAIGAVRFLLEQLARRGIAVTAGQWISSGAVTGVHRADVGQHVMARFGPALDVACSLRAAQPERPNS